MQGWLPWPDDEKVQSRSVARPSGEQSVGRSVARSSGEPSVGGRLCGAEHVGPRVWSGVWGAEQGELRAGRHKELREESRVCGA